MTSYANTNEPNTTPAATNAATMITTTPTAATLDRRNINLSITSSSPGTQLLLTSSPTTPSQLPPALPTSPQPNNILLNKKLPALPLEDFYIDSPNLLNNSNGSYSSPNTTLATSSSENYDCDSLSDGHEKADTTPENIKKIDDIIDEQKQRKQKQQQQQLQQQQEQQQLYQPQLYQQQPLQQQHRTLSTATRFNNTTNELGLAAAIDDSNAKYLFATKQKQSPTHQPQQQQQHHHQQQQQHHQQDYQQQQHQQQHYHQQQEQQQQYHPQALHQQRQHDKDAMLWRTTPIEQQHPQYEGVYQPVDDIPANYNPNNRVFEIGAPHGRDVFFTNKLQNQQNTSDLKEAESKPEQLNGELNTKTKQIEEITSETDTNTTAETETTTNPSKANKFSCAFTIDPFNDKESQDPAAAAAKYKNMLERFQNRHRRGASLSKVEGTTSETNSAMTQSATATTGSSIAVTQPPSPSPSSNAIPELRQRPLANSTPSSARTTRHNANRNSCEIVMEHCESGSAEAATAASAAAAATTTASTNVVKLRARDRSTSRVRDASKRHSWSPRSSTSELQQQQQQQQQQRQQLANSATSRRPATGTPSSSNSTTAATSKAPTPRSSIASAGNKTKPPPLQMPRGAANLVANRTQFTPRSTTMQLAMQQVDLMCPQPPLAEFAQLNAGDAADNLSEAGTYTLDGDNYTEEQKEIMNIDKNARQKQLRQQMQQKLRPKQLELKETAVTVSDERHGKRGNVLEVNYYHETPADELTPMNQEMMSAQQHADIYMQNLRTHLTGGSKLTQSTPNQCELEAERMTAGAADVEDVGIFTSVTKSGVLAKQSALDPCPNLARRGSLSTSQIDSSEYVSKDLKAKQQQLQQHQLEATAYPGGSFTDHQKSEYCLNVFHNKQDAVGQVNNKQRVTSATAMNTKMRAPSKLADTAALKTAQTKEEWIKVWARNARAHSIANDTRVSGNGSAKSRSHAAEELMTRSYTCSDTGGESLTDDTIYNNQLKKTLNARHRMLNSAATGIGAGDCDYSSDPSLASTYARSQHDVSGSGTVGGTAYKPPKSPTKIPSPMHSIGRARSTSRARPPLQNILSPDAELGELYAGQRTNVSRKNSVKSPEHAANILRAQNAYAATMLSPEDCGSPQHSIEGSPAAYRRSPSSQQHHHRYGGTGVQPRDLMTSSINEQQLQLLTSGDYINKLGRQRKNSYDGSNQINNTNSPGRRASANSQKSSKYSSAAQQEAMSSPLRRSTSFSNKNAPQQLSTVGSGAGYHQRAGRPQYQNVYTPPALRQQYTALETTNARGQHTSGGNQMIIKSASSNNFRQMYDYSDYDDRQQYYVNDQDEDLLYVEDDYMSGDEIYDDDDEERMLHDIQDEDYGNVAVQPGVQSGGGGANNTVLPHTRINKALLMRMEMNKQKFGDKPSSAPVKGKSSGGGGVAGGVGGVIACPNTPELPRRNIRSAPRGGAGVQNTRTSMPRDSSLSRLVNRVPTSLASAKKQLLQTAANGMPPTTPRGGSGQLQKVQPKYMDISKYKSAQSQDFLRRQDPRTTSARAASNEPNKTLLEGRRSTGSGGGGGGLSRGDTTRASSRSTKSMSGGIMSTSASGSLTGGNSGYGGNSQAKREWIVSKAKDVELALWKKRATYDPMKAASEDRRRKEEARRLAKAKQQQAMETSQTTGQPSTGTATGTSESADDSSQPNSLEQSFTTSTTGSCAADGNEN